MGRPPKNVEDQKETSPVPGENQGSPALEELTRHNQALTEQLKEMQKQLSALQQAAPPSVVAAHPEEMVELTYLAPVSPNNVLSLGDYGTLNGIGGFIEVPRKEFGGKFLTPTVRGLLESRRLLVCSGLTQEERRRYHVDYREGELLDMEAFDRLLDMELTPLKQLFSALCPEHQHFTAVRFISAFEKGDNRVSWEKVTALNELSRAADPNGMFRPIVEKLGQQAI